MIRCFYHKAETVIFLYCLRSYHSHCSWLIGTNKTLTATGMHFQWTKLLWFPEDVSVLCESPFSSVFMATPFWHVYVLGGVFFVWPCVPHVTFVTSHRGHWPLLIRVSGITWRGSKLLEASWNVTLYTRYVSTCVGTGYGRGRGTNKTKAIRCGACYYSIVLNAHRVTSMADTDIDAVKKWTYTFHNFNISGFNIVVLFNLSKELAYIPSNTTK
jgi:hypothetical protein